MDNYGGRPIITTVVDAVSHFDKMIEAQPLWKEHKGFMRTKKILTGCPFGPNAIYYDDGTIEAIKYIPAFDFREPWKSEILCSYGDSYWRELG